MTPKREAFVREYLIDLNATAAYIRAGYTSRGHAAEVEASKLLRIPEVAAAIAEAQKARAERTQVDADWVLRSLFASATADLADLYDASGALKPVHDWPLVWRTGLVAGVDTVQERDGSDEDGNPQFVTVRKLKLSDRTRLLELLGRHTGVGAFKDKVEIDAKVLGTVAYKANMPPRKPKA